MKMIIIKNFPDYVLDLEKMQVLSSDGSGLKPIKCHEEAKRKYFFLYNNGNRKRIGLFEIISQNWEAILSKFPKKT